MDDDITGKRREVMRWRIERNEGWRGGEEDWKEGGREVMRRMTERKEGERRMNMNEGEEAGREVVKRRIERKEGER